MLFGAYFALGQSRFGGGERARQNKNSDVFFAFILGTTILSFFWLSFVGATETACVGALNGMRCVGNTTTVLFLLCSGWLRQQLQPFNKCLTIR